MATMPTVTTLGAAYSANKGAASMLQALVDNLPGRLGETRIVAVSTHPAQDRRIYRRAEVDVEVTSQRPLEMAVLQFPLAMLAALLRLIRLPWRWLCRPAALRAIAGADVVVDISGVSFLDDRRFPVLLYNTLLVAIPLLLGRPVVKCAQAMGPFRRPLNRRLAGLVLPRLAAICPRGATTAGNLRELGLTNLVRADDLAFIMRVPEAVRRRIRVRLAEASPGPYLAVSPSQVVANRCQKQGIDYPRILAEFIDAAAEQTGHTIVMIAYAAQPDSGVNHMNDLPLCRRIHGRLRHPEKTRFFDEDLLPTELPAVIGESALLVTSRFHAMISSLVEQTPLLVVGWSHKYAEVLAPFGLQEVALSYGDLTTGDALATRAGEVLERADAIRSSIRDALTRARAGAAVNLDVIAAALGGESREALEQAPVEDAVR